MKPHFIYALVDPRTDEVRYVGKTVDLKRRMRRHRNIGRSENPSIYRDRWIQSLMDDGLDFIVWILEVCDDKNWIASEIKWIAYFKEQGCSLTNLTGGGEGWHDYVMTDEHRANLKKPKPEGFGKRISEAQKGRVKSQAHRENISKAKRGVKSTPEVKEKLSESMKNRWAVDSEFRAKVKETKEKSKTECPVCEIEFTKVGMTQHIKTHSSTLLEIIG